MNAWFDCEFTDLDAPELLSVGIVAERGDELYVELLDPVLESHSTDFVRETVLPMFGLVYGARASSYTDLATRTCEFILGLDEPVLLVFDYAADRTLLEHALERAPRWDELRDRVSWEFAPAAVYWSDIGPATMAKVWHQEEGNGLGRHHALSDARALRAACVAVDQSTASWWKQTNDR